MRPDFCGSGSDMSSLMFAGITCHERPNLSLSQPHMLSWPPFAVSFDQ